MLYAVKSNLRADLAKSILAVRERELNYYTSNILNIGQQAALLSGFAFTTLAQHNSADMLSWLEELSDQNQFILISNLQLDTERVMQAVLEVLYLTSTISAMGSTLYTLYICLLTSILGPGLALRGPEGSVDKAVFSLARVNRRVIASFAFALNLFQSSILLKAFLTFHVIAAAVCSAFVFYYAWSIQTHAKVIMRTFNIQNGEIVNGRFGDGAAGGAPDMAQGDLFPPIWEKLEDFVATLRRMVRCYCGEPPVNDPEANKPSLTSNEMVIYWQGPDGALDSKPSGGLDAWFEDLFGDERSVRQHVNRTERPRVDRTA